MKIEYPCKFKATTSENVAAVLCYYDGSLRGKYWDVFYSKHYQAIFEWLENSVGIVMRGGNRRKRLLTCPLDEAEEKILNAEIDPPQREETPKHAHRRGPQAVYKVIYCPDDPECGEPLLRKGAEFGSDCFRRDETEWPNGIIFERQDKHIQVMWYHGKLHNMDKIGGRICV